ncbi:fMet-Leu-Phe receptor-like [Tiliqua scincoides]|uniref:fMet-Leu-Phe receptor-like n=1 Tax=Tiliqua scincoides TaxID=71010 RepID=UPI0034633055
MANITGPRRFAIAYNNDNDSEEDIFVYEGWESSSKMALEKALEEKMAIFSLVIYTLVLVTGVMGNGLVIFITGFQMKKTVHTLWILNLAIADFTFTFFLIFNIAYLALGYHWPFGLVMCKLISTVGLLNLYASVYLLLVISVDRCISVRCPVWARNHRTPRLASFVVLGVWILALVLCSPNIHLREIRDVQRYDKIKTVCYLNFHRESEKRKTIHLILVIFRFIFSFVIPFGVVIFSYGAVVLKLRKIRLSSSNRPFKAITAVIVAFFICWVPHRIFLFLETKAVEEQDLQLMTRIGVPLTSSLAYFNSCLNPILYVFMGLDFKEKLRCSLFSALENAFTEDSSLGPTNTKGRLSVELVSQNL